jgi:hypothetical protein
MGAVSNTGARLIFSARQRAMYAVYEDCRNNCRGNFSAAGYRKARQNRFETEK